MSSISGRRLSVRPRQATLGLPDEYRPISLRRPAIWVGIGLLSVLCLALVIFVDPPLKAAVYGLVGIFVFSMWLIRAGLAQYPGRVRVGIQGTLRFISGEILSFWSVVCVGFVLIVSGDRVLTAFTPVSQSVGSPGLSLREGVTLLAMLVIVGYPFHRGIPPVGVELHEDGIRTRKRMSRLFIPWDELRPPGIYMSSKNPLLGLTDTDGVGHLLYPIHFGCDPVVVAEVIEYYRTHPEERHLLADPLVALQRVVTIED